MKKYKGYTLIVRKMNSLMYGVLASKNGKKIMVSSGHQQYIGVGKSKTSAINDAKDSINKWENK